MKGWRRLILCTRSNDEMSPDAMDLAGVRHGFTFVMRYNSFGGSDTFDAKSSMILSSIF